MLLINLKLLGEDFLPKMLQMENQINDNEIAAIRPNYGSEYRKKLETQIYPNSPWFAYPKRIAELGGKTTTEHLLEPFSGDDRDGLG